jgi:hypothetical protein
MVVHGSANDSCWDVDGGRGSDGYCHGQALVVTMATGVGIHSSSDGDGGDAILLKIIANKATSRIELVFKGREQV